MYSRLLNHYIFTKFTSKLCVRAWKQVVLYQKSPVFQVGWNMEVIQQLVTEKVRAYYYKSLLMEIAQKMIKNVKYLVTNRSSSTSSTKQNHKS